VRTVAIIAAWLKEIGVAGFIDIAIVALLLYSILTWMKRTKRAAAVLIGILIMAMVYLAARQFNLLLTAAVLQGFFAVILVALLVIFQEEVRYFFERLARWSLEPRELLARKNAGARPRQFVEMLSRTLEDLAQQKIGALIVIRGKDLLVRHLSGGQDLKGQASEEILKSIFDPHSLGHDGAVIIEGNIIKSFGCHLPLSKNHEKLQRMGTRHAAALGLSELTDALCLVVSEERGTITVARNGDLSIVSDPSKLAELIESFYVRISAGHRSRSWFDLIRKNFGTKVMAVGLTLALWFVLVHESKIIYRTYRIPVEYGELTDNLMLSDLEPKEVEVTLSGQRKAFYFDNPNEIKLVLKPWMFKKGKNVITISSSNLTFPENLMLERVSPNRVLATAKPK
jgi:diadenylate cyclase